MKTFFYWSFNNIIDTYDRSPWVKNNILHFIHPLYSGHVTMIYKSPMSYIFLQNTNIYALIIEIFSELFLDFSMIPQISRNIVRIWTCPYSLSVNKCPYYLTRHYRHGEYCSPGNWEMIGYYNYKANVQSIWTRFFSCVSPIYNVRFIFWR